MKKYLPIFILLFIFPLISSASSLPKFPMAFYGEVTINGKKAPEGTIIRAYYDKELVGSSTVDDLGFYGSIGSMEKKLLVGEGGEKISFSFQSPLILSNKESFGKTTISYPQFKEGLVVNKNLEFSYSKSSGGGNSGGNYSSSNSTKKADTSLVLLSEIENLNKSKNLSVNENLFNFKEVIRVGSKGEFVKELQKLLIEKGYLSGKADGSFGPATLNAVKAFQLANGLFVDGIVGHSTNAILNSIIKISVIDNTSTSLVVKNPGNYNLGTTILKNGSRGEAVKELQRYLNDTLNLGLVIDGILGPKTIVVIKQWQKERGLVPDGLVGPKTKAMMK